jgi:glyoxylase-like metal-dependent hydrolase (beta-lactamase superfamily II)
VRGRRRGWAGPRHGTITLHVAEGVHRIEDGFVNWYLLEDDDGLTVVDAGLPSSWRLLRETVATLGRWLGDIRALVLTHGHYDHVGFAEKARRELSIPVWCHPRDAFLARHPYRFKWERAPVLYLGNPGFARIFARMAASGALLIRGVKETTAYADGEDLGVPGRPRVVFTPGHTFGHCCLHLPQRDVLIAGDALVMLDPYTGRPGPRLVARAATADSAQALESLDRVAAIGARIVLTGHGAPFLGGAEEAAARARAAGTA